MRLDVLHIKTYHMLMVMTNITAGLLYYSYSTLCMDPPYGLTLWTHPVDPHYRVVVWVILWVIVIVWVIMWVIEWVIVWVNYSDPYTYSDPYIYYI